MQLGWINSHRREVPGKLMRPTQGSMEHRERKALKNHNIEGHNKPGRLVEQGGEDIPGSRRPEEKGWTDW